MPSDPWVAILTMTAVILMAVGLRGLLGRIAIFLGLIFGYLAVVAASTPSSARPASAARVADPGPHDRVDWSGVERRRLVRVPAKTVDGLVGNQTEAGNADVGWHLPSFSLIFILLALPAVIALIAENARARQGCRRDDQDRPGPDASAARSPPTVSPP